MSLLQALTETGCAVCGKHGGNVRFTCAHHFAVESIADERDSTSSLVSDSLWWARVRL